MASSTLTALLQTGAALGSRKFLAPSYHHGVADDTLARALFLTAAPLLFKAAKASRRDRRKVVRRESLLEIPFAAVQTGLWAFCLSNSSFR